jgi:heat shock protein HtpX
MNQRQWIPIEDTSAANLRRITMIPLSIVASVTFFFLIVGIIIGLPVLLPLIALLIEGGFMWSCHRNAEKSVLAMVGGTPASETDNARLFNVVDGLCVVGGDQRPALRIVDVDFPVALAVSMPGSAGIIVVSHGFTASMGRLETEAVMAHLMWRLRTGEVALTTYLLALSELLRRFGLGALAKVIVARSVDERTMLWADISSCQATRYPPALVNALDLVFAARNVPAGTVGAFPLWFATPALPAHATTGDADVSSLGFVRSSILERIAVLKEI